MHACRNLTKNPSAPWLFPLSVDQSALWITWKAMKSVRCWRPSLPNNPTMSAIGPCYSPSSTPALACRKCSIVRARDLRLDRPTFVRLRGKGRKERLCPLWPETVTYLPRVRWPSWPRIASGILLSGAT